MKSAKTPPITASITAAYSGCFTVKKFPTGPIGTIVHPFSALIAANNLEIPYPNRSIGC